MFTQGEGAGAAAELRELTPGAPSVCNIEISKSSQSEVITALWRAHLSDLSLGSKSGSSTLERDRRELDAILRS